MPAQFTKLPSLAQAWCEGCRHRGEQSRARLQAGTDCVGPDKRVQQAGGWVKHWVRAYCASARSCSPLGQTKRALGVELP